VVQLATVISETPEVFEPKHRWAMDWYYPVLSGAVTGEAAGRRLAEGWETFVMDRRGVRCVADRPWITAAETCECALAHLRVGDETAARGLVEAAQALRADDGAYFTGVVYPEEIHFPDDEQSTYTAAAMILAADALDGVTPAADIFLVTPTA
jgi:hypothetical protein